MKLKKTFEYEGEKFRFIIVSKKERRHRTYTGDGYWEDIIVFKLYKEFKFKLPLSNKEIGVFGIVSEKKFEADKIQHAIKHIAENILLNYMQENNEQIQFKKKTQDSINEFLNWGNEDQTVDKVI